jgi:hypothetical protein
LRVVGRVVDGTDNPIPNARLTSWLDSKDTAISDASGAFDFIMSVKAQDRTFWLTVEKAGYETSELSRNVVDAATTVLRLHRIQSLEAGNSLRALINPDDSACGYHWGYICRRVRVTSPSSGRLTLEVVSDGTTGLGMPMGPAGFPQSLERRMSTSVRPGVEVSVDIAASWPLDVSTAFTLNTLLTSEN